MAGVNVTVTFVRVFAACAVQISASPDCALERLTSVQVSPPPLTVTVWRPAPDGPSLPTNATSVSPAAVVENAGVVTAPWPVTVTDLSTVGAGPPPPPPPPLVGTVTVTGTAVAMLPLESVARALSVWLPGVVLPTVQLKV